MQCAILVFTVVCSLYVEGYIRDLAEVIFEPLNSAFILDSNGSVDNKDTLYFATASNVDTYSLRSYLGIFQKRLSFTGDKEVSDTTLHASVHLFNTEVDEKSKSIHFVCHVIFPRTHKSTQSPPSSTCCVISLNTTFSHEFTSCVLGGVDEKSVSVCHAQARLPVVLWEQKNSPVIALSYTVFKVKPVVYRNNKDNECHITNSVQPPVFHLLPTATVVRSVPDAIRELGRSLLLQIPRRELRTNEEFMVPVRLKRGDEVSDFTLRCEIPSNSYVEFVRVIWPGGLTSTKHAQTEFGTLPGSLNSDGNGESVGTGTLSAGGGSGLNNVWDVFHRTIVSPKRNVTEIVARFREDLARALHASKHTPTTEVYKLLFRVNRPAAGSQGRVAPRIFWSLVSLSRRNSPDRTAGGSPIVTRLNIESSELKHLAMVLKTSALVNLAVLTGQTAVYPVWVYGLTHDIRLIDVTARATCHSGDDAVIHFASDDCRKLGFSGAELDGSPGLPLVAKLDGRSATATLLVWFPKSPAIRLVVDAGQGGVEITGPRVPTALLKRLGAGPAGMSSGYGVSSWPLGDNGGNTNSTTDRGVRVTAQISYQFARIRVLARFILAGSVLYDKDVLGGKVDQYVDVTDFTAHRIRLEKVDWLDDHRGLVSARSANPDAVPVSRLILTGGRPRESLDEEVGPITNAPMNYTHWQPIRAWILGHRAGRMRVRLAPIDRAHLKSRMPPGLVKQLKDQKSDLIDSADLDSFGDDSLWAGIVKDEPTLEVIVRDEPGSWPVGISAQVVTDFSMVLSQMTDQENSGHSAQSIKSTGSRHPIMGDSSSYTADHLMPLYSGLYALQFSLQGGKLANSGAVATDFHESLRHSSLVNNMMPHGRPIELRNQSDREISVPMEQETGLLLIWIHMSNGMSLMWNRLREISKASGQALPFRLTINNLRPDLFSVSEHGLEPKRHRKRSVPTWWYSKNVTSSEFVMQQDFDSTVAELTDPHPLNEIHNTDEVWDGPSVRLLRSGVSYSGEILEVGLDSPNGQTLVPKTRVHADFHIRHADPLSVNSEVEPNEPYSAYAPQTKGVVDSTVHNRNLQIPVSQIHSSNHGYVPLKDAPGFRNLILDQHKQLVDQMPNTVIKGDQLHETSLSDQRGDEKFGPSSVVLDDGLSEAKPTGNSGFVRSASYSGGSASITGTGTGLHTSADMDANDSAGNGSRPALEMSMYILLGLFALVGLVFAVNCGAVVARYRWERIGRRRTNVPPSADTDGVTDVERDMSQLAHSESGQKSITKTAESTGTGLEPNADQIGESSLRRCSKFLIPFKNKNKAVLHRDTNWVWIGRDKTGETQGNQGNGLTPSPLVDCHRSANSPLLGTADVPKTGAPTASSSTTPSGAHGPVSGVERSNGRKQNAHNLNTTAVLSVGEADMLLLHSPYHQDAWQDTLRSTSADRDTMAPFAIGWPYTVTPGVSQDPHGLLATSSTVGRPPRRHTAGALTQRNYQGQECSIRIISNPMPQPMSSPHNGQESADSASQEHAQEKNVSQHWLAYYQPDGLQTPQGSRTPVSASASVSRKQRTPIASWTSKDQRGDNDRAGSNYVQIDWNSGSRPNPYPRMQIPPPHHVPSTLIPPPNHPAPPIPYGHLRPKDAAYYWEAIMYRSWVRPRSGWKIPQSVSDSTTTDLAPTQTSQDWSPWNVRTRRSLSNASEAIGDSLSREANHISQWDYIRSANMLKTLRESREHTFNRSTEMPVNVENLAPFPPVRTTSRTVESQTLGADKAKRKVSLDANPRPLSLPQNFQATNELYGAVTQDSLELGGTSGDLEAEHQAKPKGGRSAGGPDTSPSEESLWWYHPVRRRPRKRRHEQNPHRQHPAGPQASRTHGHRQDHHVHEQGAGDASVPQNRYAPNKPLLCGQPDPIEYACPAPCDCDCGQPPLKAMHTGGNPGAPRIPHLIPTATETDNKTGIPAALLHSSTLSGLAWDQDLLALSHDRLVAYFAGMKESDA